MPHTFGLALLTVLFFLLSQLSYLLINLPQSYHYSYIYYKPRTTYTIITEDSDGSFQSVSLRELKAMSVDTFMASQDPTNPPWDDCPYFLWVYTGVLPHNVFQVTAREDHPIRSMMNPAGRIQFTRRLLQDILDVATSYRLF